MLIATDQLLRAPDLQVDRTRRHVFGVVRDGRLRHCQNLRDGDWFDGLH